MTTRANHHLPITRAILLHTSGIFWIDVAAIKGCRSEPFIRWLPGSPQIPLGHLSSALQSLPSLFNTLKGEISHFVLCLSPNDSPPIGRSGELAIATAIIWYLRAVQQGLSVTRPMASDDAARPTVILAGSGTLDLAYYSDRLAHYEVGAVLGWEAKARQIDRAIREKNVVEGHILCARHQLRDTRRAFQRAFGENIHAGTDQNDPLETSDGVRLYLHPIENIRTLAALMPRWLLKAEQLEADLGYELAEEKEGRATGILQEHDNRDIDCQVRRLRVRMSEFNPLQRGDILHSCCELLEVAYASRQSRWLWWIQVAVSFTMLLSVLWLVYNN